MKGRFTSRAPSVEASAIEEASAAVLPINVIFLSANEDTSSAGSLKGGFKRPNLEIMNFWFGIGMERWVAISSDRSDMVASEENE